jgi:hypothetical protein
MLVRFHVFYGSLCAAALLLVATQPAQADDAKTPAAKTDNAQSPAATRLPAVETKSDADDAKEPAAAKAPAKKVKQLSPEMAERRDRVRKLLAALRGQPFNTQQNTCTDVLDFCRAFGCETELADNASSGQKINGITCLCWNMSCAGYELMTVSEGHLAPRVGYGYQNNSSEMAAILALSHVPGDYPARAGKTVRTVADLIEYEKLTCRPGRDMSLKLVALAYYVTQPSWKDSLGGEWTLQRVVAEELARPLGGHPHAATNRLLGLCAALERFKTDKVPLEGDLARGKQYIDQSTDYAYASQNIDGSWGRPTNRDYATAVAYTAHMLQWLVTALPANRLEESQIVRGIDYLHTTFNSPHYQNYIATMSAREISAAMHAAYVLNTYDRRVFAPADPPPAPAEPAKTEKPEQKSASRAGQVQ